MLLGFKKNFRKNCDLKNHYTVYYVSERILCFEWEEMNECSFLIIYDVVKDVMVKMY